MGGGGRGGAARTERDPYDHKSPCTRTRAMPRQGNPLAKAHVSAFAHLRTPSAGTSSKTMASPSLKCKRLKFETRLPALTRLYGCIIGVPLFP